MRVRIPLAAGRETRFRKVGTRRAQAISKVVLALELSRADGGVVGDVRVALGSVAPTPIRARDTEAVARGRPPTPETADRAAETLPPRSSRSTTCAPPPSTAALVAARVLHRLIREAGGW